MKSGDVCSIYLLTNSANGKIYVGQTWLPLHIRMGKEGSNYKNSLYLYNAIQKYGADKFKYETLAQCRDQTSADYLEEYFIDKYDSRNQEIGYNLKHGGSAGKHSDETIAKISNTLKAQAALWSPEELARRSAPISGYWEGKQRGPHTDEWKENNSQFMIERHKIDGHPMLGKHQTDEAKTKISTALKGRVLSPEAVKKSAEARKMPIERELAIVQAYQNGDIISKIETDFQTGRSSIYRILDRNNVARKIKSG